MTLQVLQSGTAHLLRTRNIQYLPVRFLLRLKRSLLNVIILISVENKNDPGQQVQDEGGATKSSCPMAALKSSLSGEAATGSCPVASKTEEVTSGHEKSE